MRKTDDERRLLVLSRSRREFVDFCRRHDLNPRRRDVVWVPDPERLRGYRNEWLLALSSIDPGLLDFLTTVDEHILVEEPVPTRPLRLTLPEFRTRRGGIKYGESGNRHGS